MKVFVFLLTIIVINVHAQTKINEGIILYSVTSWDKNNKEIIDSIYPKAVAVYFKGDMERIDEYDDGRAMAFYLIINTKTNNFISLVDSNGKKEGIVTQNEATDQERGISKKKSYKEMPDTCTIAKHKCKRIRYPHPSGFGNLYIYYTDELNIPILNPVYFTFDEFDGFAMQLEEDTPDFHYITTVESIRNEKVDDNKFKIPEGYHIIDQYGNENPVINLKGK